QREGAVCHDDFRRKRDQFFRVSANPRRITATPSDFKLHIAIFGPAQLMQQLYEHRETSLLGCRFGRTHEHADPSHPVGLLRARRERPRRRPADERDERAALHSITSSAATSSLSGTVSPSVRAVWLLMTSSNFEDCRTGRSPDFAPLRTRPA